MNPPLLGVSTLKPAWEKWEEAEQTNCDKLYGKIVWQF